MANNQIYYANGGGDEQYTPIKTVEILLPYIQHLKDKIIWCPFDREDSQFVKILTNNGFDVVYSHIDYGQDFFKYEPKQWDVIISNPPYHNKRAFWERCLDLKKPFTLLLPVNILSDSIINATMRERERIVPAHPKSPYKVLQRKDRRNWWPTNIQSGLFWCRYFQTATYIGRFTFGKPRE